MILYNKIASNMKNIITTVVLAAMFYLPLAAQTVNDKPIREIDSEYMQIVGIQNLMSTKVTVEVDFGEMLSGKDVKVKDAAGKTIKFNSMIDALNFFSKNGYDFVEAYGFTDGDVKTYLYLMKKRK